MKRDHDNLGRRNFLKGSAFVAGAAAGTSLLSGANPELEAAEAPATTPTRTSVLAACPYCGVGCGTMIETEEAIANVDEIAKVPGIDMIMIGSTDLTTRMGIPGQWGHEKLQYAYKKVGAACKKNGKHLGLGGIGDNVWAPHYIKQGARMVLAHSDHGMIMEAGTNRANLLRALEKKGAAKKKA